MDAPDAPTPPASDELPSEDVPRIGASRLVGIAILFEGGLGVLAISVGLLIDYWPLAHLHIGATIGTLRDFGIGVAASLPMLVGLILIDRFPAGELRGLKDLVENRLLPLFEQASVGQLFLISVAAGIGEELLFRGLLQAGLSDWIGGTRGVAIAVIVSSLVFGMCHWLSNTYAVIATLMGAYFAGLFLITGNLLAPIVTHALYDFAALLYMVKWKPRWNGDG